MIPEGSVERLRNYIDKLVIMSRDSFLDGRIMDMDEQDRQIRKYLHSAYLRGELVWRHRE
jgi:hypothetical protein